MKPFAREKEILPAFPRTPHLPYHPNMVQGDVLATPEEAESVFTLPVNIEEKLDGASVGIGAGDEGEIILRNRDHVLRKGYKKDTPAKMQFRPLWGWVYNHRNRFRTLFEHGRFSVYGEWLWMQHGLEYDSLPDWFVAYDLYDRDEGRYVAPPLARAWLQEAGFTTPKLFHQGDPTGLTYDVLSTWAQTPGEWTRDHDLIEGIYLKTYDDRFVTGRAKLVRPDFKQGALFDSSLRRNSLRRA